MNQKHVKHLDLICAEFEKACKKHPKFCDALTNKSRDSVRKDLAELRIENSEVPYYADRLLHEEICEGLEAYLDGDKEHTLQELAQCGAVILRMMEFVKNEMEA